MERPSYNKSYDLKDLECDKASGLGVGKFVENWQGKYHHELFIEG